ncbi:cysteine hydrolase family protein [Bacillus sp. KH172YL63]|uniref:cysteine hydrolase family protein n=1 Tax=Bacillus sp. KH172YL63 TaxID=2709784 RepID=UPI0013E50D5A|nr:cysteine hydrolase family protein [Bacillus sp. KH172YL63]BCB03682.1 isochorismatase [Bacillus sp. KH172YL63]
MKEALLVIDVQNGMFSSASPVHGGEVLLQHINGAVKYAKTNEIPIIYIRHNGKKGSPLEKGTEGWRFHERIAPGTGALVVEKKTPDSFYRTGLHQVLKEKQIEHLIVAGIQTEACVDTTCRAAFSLDYKVTLLSDAHSTFDKQGISAEQIISHHNEVLRWFADTVPTGEWILR